MAARTALCRRSCCRAGTIHAAGPYFCPNVRIKSTAVATNVPPHGAFRGFGAPQRHLRFRASHGTKVASVIGLSPEEFRRRNFIKEGGTTATNQVIREKVDLEGLLNRAFELTDYHAKRERFKIENEQGSSPTVREGVNGPTRGSDEPERTPSLTVGLLPRIKRGIGFASFHCMARGSLVPAKSICNRWWARKQLLKAT